MNAANAASGGYWARVVPRSQTRSHRARLVRQPLRSRPQRSRSCARYRAVAHVVPWPHARAMIPGMNSRFVWMNGTLVESAKATVPFLTAGFHYGIAVFEGIRAYSTDRGPAVFRLRDHLRRFEASAKILGFRELPYSVDELIDATAETVRASAYAECYIRPMVWLGEGGWNLTLDTGKPLVAIAVWEQSVYLGQSAPSRGVRACVSSFMRSHPAANMTKAKIAGNYVNSYLAKTDAHRQGFD